MLFVFIISPSIEVHHAVNVLPCQIIALYGNYITEGDCRVPSSNKQAQGHYSDLLKASVRFPEPN